MSFFESTSIGEGMSIELDTFDEPDLYCLAYWERAIPLVKSGGMTLRQKFSLCWHILRNGRLWTDMLIFDAKTMKNIAYHILYRLDKAEKEKKKPEVDLNKIFE